MITGAARFAILSALAFAVAGGTAFAVAGAAAVQIEDRTLSAVTRALQFEGLDWVTLSADGLQLVLEGEAPDEAARFAAIRAASGIVDAARLVDRIEVRQAAAFTPPPYTLEMLRNDDGVSLIGLIPEGDRAAIADDLDAVGGMDVVDMVEIADYAVPPGWPAAVAFGVEALQILPRSKVSVTEGRVEIEAVSRSPEERVRWLSELERVAPGGIDIVIDISAPRPVITPFTLRFVRTAESARFEACSVDTEAARDRVLDAARAAGLDGPATCQIGLGVPSPRWTQAVEAALTAIAELPEASVTFSDADVTLVAAPGTPRDLFDRVVGDLDAELPAVFSLHGVLPEPDEQSDTAGPPNFTAVLTEDGRIELRGRLPDARIEAAVRAFARAEFGEDVLVATRRVGDLPAGWPARVLAGLGALAELESGTLRVEPERVSITGETGNPDAVSDISRALGEELGEAADFAIDVTYVEALDPATLIPTPEECIDRIETILDLTKITFEPGSVELTAAANSIIDALAAVLPDCAHVEMEIGGHTDSQGRESMNLRLSQSRAEAVLNGLLARDILIGNLSARGYGETRPIADNDTEEGREINRRIEFRLVADVAAENAAFAEAQRLDEIASWPRPVPRPARAEIAVDDPDAAPEETADDAVDEGQDTPTVEDPGAAPVERPGEAAEDARLGADADAGPETSAAADLDEDTEPDAPAAPDAGDGTEGAEE